MVQRSTCCRNATRCTSVAPVCAMRVSRSPGESGIHEQGAAFRPIFNAQQRNGDAQLPGCLDEPVVSHVSTDLES